MAGVPLNEGRKPLPLSSDRPNAAKHGGTGTLYNRGCKCDECRAAHSVRMQEARVVRHEKMLLGEVNPPHGKVSTYTNYLCRCDPCVAAHAQSCADYAAKRKAEKS